MRARVWTRVRARVHRFGIGVVEGAPDGDAVVTHGRELVTDVRRVLVPRHCAGASWLPDEGVLSDTGRGASEKLACELAEALVQHHLLDLRV